MITVVALKGFVYILSRARRQYVIAHGFECGHCSLWSWTEGSFSCLVWSIHCVAFYCSWLEQKKKRRLIIFMSFSFGPIIKLWCMATFRDIYATW